MNYGLYLFSADKITNAFAEVYNVSKRHNIFCYINFLRDNILYSRILLYLCISLFRIMHVISHRKLKEFYETSGMEDSKIALERWYNITEKAIWHNLAEIKEDFPTTDYVGNQHYVFNIKGNHYRLIVVVKFTIGRVFIRFVGTHTDYDKIDASTI